MIDVTSAVRTAGEYFKSIESDLNGKTPENLRLEEIEKTEDGNYWLITLGHDVINKVNRVAAVFSPSDAEPGLEYSREYKLFRVNASTGEVESMKIRKV